MKILAIATRKGGVAKTATALNISAGLHLKGKKILAIDLDAQADLTRNLAVDPENTTTSVYEVLTREATPEKAIVKTAEGIDLIPASPMLATIDKTISEKRREYRLAEALEPIRKRYNYIIIDTPPGLGTAPIMALTSADSVMIPAEPKKASLDAIIQMNDSIEAVKRYTNERLKIEGILVTRAKIQTILTKDMISNLEQVAKHLHTKVFSTVIRDCSAIGECEAVQQSIFTYAPRSNGAKDYMNVVEEILKKGDRRK